MDDHEVNKNMKQKILTGIVAVMVMALVVGCSPVEESETPPPPSPAAQPQDTAEEINQDLAEVDVIEDDLGLDELDDLDDTLADLENI